VRAVLVALARGVDRARNRRRRGLALREHADRRGPRGRARSVVAAPIRSTRLGSPFGNENSLDVGVVSGIRRSIDSLTSSFQVSDAIQIDAPITHGYAGGPVFDARGRVIGIATQIRTDSGQAEDVGFAVPIDSARRSLLQLVTTGKVAYAFAGVRTTDVTPSIAHALGLSVTRGAARGQGVEQGSGAERAGLRQGSKAREIAAEGLARIVSEELHPGQTVTFAILRDVDRQDVHVRLGSRTP
jgi:S1-C subfamily serine protease